MASDAKTVSAIGRPRRWWCSSVLAIGGPTISRFKPEYMCCPCVVDRAGQTG